MSWTTEVDKARWLAAAVEPGGRLEAEIVVDPSMLGRLRRL
jgi:hypothetical protein